MWADATGDFPGRRIRILALRPAGAPSGVEARVLTSVSGDRRVFTSFKDLRENYDQEET